MKQGQKVKITKIGVVADPKFPTPPKEGYVYGTDNGDVSLPIEYEALGTLEADVKVGSSLLLLRTHRNGIEVPGILRTSHITSIDDDLISTANSRYRVVSV